jgi:ppGpp synthetase/RelA/SpoT-type nucleotidyltranferase
MDFETYSRTKLADYAALAETVASILRAALDAYPETFRLQQVQHRPKNPDSLRKKLEDRGIVATTSLEDDIKDLAGCRLIFYTNSDVMRFLRSGIIRDNFEVDWDRTKIYHPVPGQTETDNLFISNNYVLKLKADRTALPEYARFSGLLCEVQVQTTLNHAWAEMEHDIIYKKPALKGFGGKLFEAIEQRLRKIMKDHLLPAGFEFQKALDDHERLLSGKELFDRGALKALADCKDNNARYELLERFRDYVLPNYDDPQSVYPEIKEQLVAAVKAARLMRQRPIETPFGNLPGITVERIVDVVADILTHLRYVDIELTFDALCQLFPDAQGDEERKHLLGLAQRLSQHDLDVWKQAGPYVQTVLVQKIGTMDRSNIGPLRPLLLEILGEALKSEVHGTSSTYKTITLNRGSAVPSGALARMRKEAIELLISLYRTAPSESDKRLTEVTLFEATHTPNGGHSNELLAGILQDSATIVDFFTGTAPDESYEILQTIEHKLLWMYRRNQGIPEAMAGDEAVAKARAALNTSILRFRDAVNANKGYTMYKTLVGFESVFPPAWDDQKFDLEGEEAYREDRIDELVAEVNEQNAEEWLAILQRCAQTESNDAATFPSFGKFLQKLSKSKPKIVLGFIDRLGDRLTGFLGIILSGLAQSDQRTDVDAKIAEWLREEKHLVEIAHYEQFVPEFDPALLQKVLRLGIKKDDDNTVAHVLSAAARRYSEMPDGLIETTFMPAIEYFSAKHDGRWINLVWFIKRDQTFLRALTAEQVDVVLRSLIYLPTIDTHAEFVLRHLAAKYPEKVFDFFGERLRYGASGERDSEDRYQDVPFQFYSLQKSFAGIVEHATGFVRKLFVSGDSMFQFRGGRLLATSFPDYSEPFARNLESYVMSGNRDDIDFVVQILSSYHGEVSLNETCKEVVRALAADDALLSDVEIVLQNTGVVSGEFGMVQAYQSKKQEMAGWLGDPDAKVRAFAESYVRLLDRQIAAEQRRSEESIEMRKRMYGDPDEAAA